MSFMDALFGRQKPVKPSEEKIFAITTAVLTMQTSLNLSTTPRAGICFKPVISGHFEQIKADLDGLLGIAAKDGQAHATTFEDEFHFKWIIIQSDDFELLTSTIHMVSQSLIEQGYGEMLLCSVFRFEDAQERPIYWIYNYKRGTFYPFVPVGPNKRDNAMEFRLGSNMKQEMPIEAETAMWYAVWGVPV